MSAALNLAAPEPAHQTSSSGRQATLLRLLTCGSVDDGKSTLLGRLLFDSNAVLDDQLTALDRDSKRFGTQGDDLDFALLVDGLSAEREQGITIDVAYRYFSTEHRSFIVADTPGHEQYTRNMATGASNAELAIILVDARKGILPQTRRHSYIVSMLGVRHVVVAVNKMDLVGFGQDTYTRIVNEYRDATATLGFSSIVAIPICAREGDNVVTRSARTSWYQGPPLLEYLETVSITPASVTDGGFHLPVQWVNRPNLDFRGYAGTIASGIARVGQAVAVLPAGSQSQISRIVTADGDLTSAVAGQSVTVTLADEIDVSRGDVIVPVTHILPARTRVSARLLWMDEGRLTKGASLIVKLATATANARMAELIHAVDIHSFTPRPATSLGMNEIGLVDLAFDKPLVVTDYQTNQELGAFILIDRMTNQTVALGMIEPGQGDGEASSWVRRIGGTFGTGSAGFWQSATSHLLGAGLLAALVFAVSDNPIAAAAVAAGEVLLAPALRQLVKAVWPVGAASSS